MRKNFKNQDLNLTILEALNAPLSPVEIARKLEMKGNRFNYHLKKLRNAGFVNKIGYGTWELTPLGLEKLRTTKEQQKLHAPAIRFDLWGAGNRYHIVVNKDIPGLKEITLKNGGKVWQGHIGNCWVMKTGKITDIKSIREKSVSSTEALAKAMTSVQKCKDWMEEQYGLKLDFIYSHRPEFNIIDPNAQRLAKKIHDNVGRVRTDNGEINISLSKDPDNPDYEVYTAEHAKNTIDNLAITNKADDIKDILKQLVVVIQKQTERDEIFAKGMSEHMKLIGALQGLTLSLDKTVKAIQKNGGLWKWAKRQNS